MDRKRYKDAMGFVVSYKASSEPLLFNELHGRCGGLELLERGVDSAVFSSGNYAAAVEQLHKEDFVFLQHKLFVILSVIRQMTEVLARRKRLTLWKLTYPLNAF